MISAAPLVCRTEPTCALFWSQELEIHKMRESIFADLFLHFYYSIFTADHVALLIHIKRRCQKVHDLFVEPNCICRTREILLLVLASQHMTQKFKKSVLNFKQLDCDTINEDLKMRSRSRIDLARKTGFSQSMSSRMKMS